MILDRFGENDDVVQVYNHAIEMKVSQHFLHQSLKGRRGIPQAKRHFIAFIDHIIYPGISTMTIKTYYWKYWKQCLKQFKVIYDYFKIKFIENLLLWSCVRQRNSNSNV